jgi:hypothetical protein
VAQLFSLGGSSERKSMALETYKTNRRLWMWITAALFILFWLVEIAAVALSRDHSGQRLAGFMWYCIVGLFHGRLPFGESVGFALPIILLVSCVNLVAALVFGWLFHSFIVIIQTKHRERMSHAA